MITTLQLGKKITKKDLENAGFKVGDWAKEVLEKVTFKKQKVNLIVKTVAELGLSDGGTLEEIYKKAEEQGLELCPAEVGPALRMAYKDQPKGEWLSIAMEPITDSYGFLRVFYVERDDDGLWLGGDYGDPHLFLAGDDRLVFVRRKYSSKSSKSLTSLDSLNLESAIKLVKKAGYQISKII